MAPSPDPSRLPPPAATSMKWIEAKMQELGVLTNPSYKIAMLVDDGAMITVQDEKGRVVR